MNKPDEWFDSEEFEDWAEALEGLMQDRGPEVAHSLLLELSGRLGKGSSTNFLNVATAYRNTITMNSEAKLPGDPALERKIRSLIRWNALAMVVRANQRPGDLGGHISSFASSATLYDVGFNYFFRAPKKRVSEEDSDSLGDLLYIQGHASPGIYARSFLEGRINEKQLDNFRRETGDSGLSSYPHPWLMPDYWQFPTVSMGLGPIQAIYQAHLMKYLDFRGLSKLGTRKVWAFLGDGECDEPESLGALSLAGREKLDNLIFVVNCNLQRLDGPVRGNGKIIQELEGCFRGAGWNVIKVVWGRLWDPLFEADKKNLLQRAMDETVDGEYQNFKAKGGKYVRKNFFGKHPELLRMVEHLSDEEIYRLNRGGHDPHKIYSAYHSAVNHSGQPTVILAKTVKGYGMGEAGESENTTHQVKKLNLEDLKHFRDRFDVPLTDEELQDVPYYRPEKESPEISYMLRNRERLGGFLPKRIANSGQLRVPELEIFKAQLDGTGEREISSTMAFVRILATLLRDKELGRRIVPIVPDEARTFGMEGMFRQLGIYSSEGQLYVPEDSEELAAYKESDSGQVLEEGITEAGAFAAWMAAATSYSNHQFTLLPFYIFYSMFGFQRIGDLAWAAGDLQAKGFLLGGTAGKTTLNGEGLQHQDGHSHLLASSIPNCISYDPSYAYELAVIIQHGLHQMYVENRSVYYYITIMNEAYRHPRLPENSVEGIIKGVYLLETLGEPSSPRVRIFGSGSLLPEARKAAEALVSDYKLQVQVFSVTSYTELIRNSQDYQRDVLLNNGKGKVRCYLTDLLSSEEDWANAPVIAVSDHVKSLPEQLRGQIPAPYRVLGTDGFGRSDTREQLRAFFEVDRYFIQFCALTELVAAGTINCDLDGVTKELGIDKNKPNPRMI